MSFYYNYTGPNAGTVRVNEANQTPQTQQPVNPWHSPAPNTQASNPTPQTASTTFVYHPRYGSGSPPAAQPKPAEPVNPWKAPAPEADKASTFHAMSFARQSCSYILIFWSTARPGRTTSLSTFRRTILCRPSKPRTRQRLARIYQSTSRRAECSPRAKCRSLSTHPVGPSCCYDRPTILLPRT